MAEISKFKIALFLVVVVLINRAAFGTPILKAALNDLVRLSETEQPERPGSNTLNWSYEYENTVKSRDLVLNNADSLLNIVLPLEEHLLAKNGVLGISVLGNHSQFQANYATQGIDLSNQSDIIRLVYGVQLNDYLGVGVGVSQYRDFNLNLDRSHGQSYAISITPLKTITIEYASERTTTGSLTKIDYDGEWLEYPTIGIVDQQSVNFSTHFGKRLDLDIKHEQEKISPYQTTFLNQGTLNNLGDTTEIKTSYEINEQVKFSGLVGRGDTGQNVVFYEDGDKFAYMHAQKSNLFGSLSMAWNLEELDLDLSISRSNLDLASQGKVFSENLPDIISGLDNFDKTFDLEGSIVSNGAHLGLNKTLSDRLSIKTKISYLSIFLDGDANLWNSWFFGAVRELDENFPTPIKRIDLVELDLGFAYAVQKDMELSYTVKQLIPVLVDQSEATGVVVDNNVSTSQSVASGGNTHMLSLTYYF